MASNEGTCGPLHLQPARRADGRVLFLAAGLVSAITAFLPIQEGANRAGEFIVGVIAIGVAIFAWTAPWDRWRRSRSLWLAVLAFAILAATYVTNSSSGATFATYFVVVFVWVGISHPRWTSVRLLPLGVAAYVVPLIATGGETTAVDSTLEVAVLCGMVGEALAWVSEKLRIAEAADERRGYQMQMLLRSAELLACENEPTRLPGLVADLAVHCCGPMPRSSSSWRARDAPPGGLPPMAGGAGRALDRRTRRAAPAPRGRPGRGCRP